MATATPLLTDGVTIAEAARATGLSAHTLRYYERADLMLDPVGRAASGGRRFREADIRWIGLLTKMRRTGMPIRVMRAYTELVRAGDGNEAERLELLEAHREEVLAQLAEVRRNLRAIDEKIDLYRSRLEG